MIFTFFPVHKSFPSLEPGFTDLRLGRHHPFYQRRDILFFVFPWVASTLTEKKKIWISAFCSCARGVRVSLFQRVGIFCQSAFVQRSGAAGKTWHLDQTMSGFNLPLMILNSQGVLHMTSWGRSHQPLFLETGLCTVGFVLPVRCLPPDWLQCPVCPDLQKPLGDVCTPSPSGRKG